MTLDDLNTAWVSFKKEKGKNPTEVWLGKENIKKWVYMTYIGDERTPEEKEKEAFGLKVVKCDEDFRFELK